MAYARGICVFGLIVLAVLTISEISGVEGNKKKKMEFKCLGEPFKFTESQKTAMKECKDEMKAAKGDEEEKSSDDKEDHKKKWAAWKCFEACTLRKNGILVNDDPEFNFDKLDEMIDSTIPEAARAGVKADARKCYEDVSEPLTNEDNCKSHETYQKCVRTAYHKHCKKDGEDETM